MSSNDIRLENSHCSKKPMLTFYLLKIICDQIGRCRKIDQGQPKVMIDTNYDGPGSSMLHTKFRRSIGSGEEEFF